MSDTENGMKKATFTKLRNGSWGLRVQGTVTIGATVETTTKAGKVERKTVGKVIWTGNGISLCEIAAEAQQPPHHSSARGRCAECDSPCNPRFPLCWDCKVVQDEDMGIYR